MNCAVCSGPTSLRCAGCRSVFYCSREHQKSHWSKHRRECKPYEMRTSERQGRYLVATRDMKPGEVVLRETALVLGPKAASPAICLGCHHILNGKAQPCPGCKWPLCSPACQFSPFHVPECDILKKCGNRLDPMTLVAAAHSSVTAAYSFLTPLRCLLLKTSSKKSWESLLSLQSHLEERISTPTYVAYRRNVAQFIGGVLELYSEGFDDETILRMCAILDTNSFEVRCRAPKGNGGKETAEWGEIKARAILPIASLINHDCRPNTRHIFEQEAADGGPWRKVTMVVYTTVPVRKGEPLTATYTQTLWPTKRRRAHLLSTKCFICECKRCSDPTELETNLGAMRCLRGRQNGCNGLILPTKPLEDTSPWKCTSCQQESQWQDVDAVNQSLHDEILERASKANKAKNGEKCIKMAPEILEEFLTKYQTTLHPKNHHMLQVKHALIQIYGNIAGFKLKELSYDMLERKAQLCDDLLEVVNSLEPGMASFRSDLIHALYTTLNEKSKRYLAANKIQTDAEKQQFADAKKMVQEVIEVLKTEYDMKDFIHL